MIDQNPYLAPASSAWGIIFLLTVAGTVGTPTIAIGGISRIGSNTPFHTPDAVRISSGGSALVFYCDSSYGGIPRGVFSNTAETEPNNLIANFPGAALNLVIETGNDMTQGGPNGPNQFPVATLNGQNSNWAYYAWETIGPETSGNTTTYEVTGAAPFFWGSLGAVDDAIPTASGGGPSLGWCTQYTGSGIPGCSTEIFTGDGTPIRFYGNDLGTPEVRSGILMLGDELKLRIEDDMNNGYPWNERLAEIPYGRVAFKVRVDLTNAAPPALASIMFRRSVPSTPGTSIDEAYLSSGYFLDINNSGGMALRKSDGAGGITTVRDYGVVAPGVSADVGGVDLEVRTHNGIPGEMSVLVNGALVDTWVDPSPHLGPHFGLFASVGPSNPASYVRFSHRYVFDVGVQYTVRYEDIGGGDIRGTYSVQRRAPVTEPHFYHPWQTPIVFMNIAANPDMNTFKAWDRYGRLTLDCFYPAGELDGGCGLHIPGSQYTVTRPILRGSANPATAAWIGNQAETRGLYVKFEEALVDSSPSSGPSVNQGWTVQHGLNMAIIPFDSPQTINNYEMRMVWSTNPPSFDPPPGSCPPDTRWTSINNPAPAASDHFGNAVAIDKDRIVIGSPRANQGLSNTGKAFLYGGEDGGQLISELVRPGARQGDLFGTAVTIGRTFRRVIYVGAPFGPEQGGSVAAGAVYTFDEDGGYIGMNGNPNPDDGDQFGAALAASDFGYFVAGAPFDDPGGIVDAGTATIIHDATEIATLQAPPGSLHTDARFGDGVDIAMTASGTGIVAVAASREDTSGMDLSGAVHIFDHQGSYIRRITSPSVQTFSRFGWDVAFSGHGTLGQNVLISEPFRDDLGFNNLGRAYVFDAMSGALLATLEPTTENHETLFGYSTGLYEDTAIIGALRNVSGVTAAGRFYLYDVTTGANLAVVNPVTPQTSAQFAVDVDIYENRAIVGANLQDDQGQTDTGKAYVYACASVVPSPTPTPPPCPTPFPGILYVDGSYSGCETGSPTTPFNTIMEAVTAASNGYTIRIQAGTYPETINTSKVLEWVNEGGPVHVN